MKKFRVKKQTNTITKGVRYIIQKRDWFLFVPYWYVIEVHSEQDVAEYVFNKLIQDNSWK